MTRVMLATREGDEARLPGMASVHSHAFQRALRGRGQEIAAGASFWSWREAMYRVASRLDPESIGAISEFAFAELASLGVTAVGEFHYVHNAPDGSAYADRTVMAKAVIDAARRVGLRISLLRVHYERPGFGRKAEGTQRRFCSTVDETVRDVESLQKAYADDNLVRVGVAPHSLRAAGTKALTELGEFANARSLPLHMHVAEQKREVRECLAEHQARPIEYLQSCGLLGPRFTAVHATHLSSSECKLLRDCFVALCRTTERDLGDGHPPTVGLRDAGARICVGVDSHAISDPFVELRAVELDARQATEKRQVAFDGTGLLKAASAVGYASIGFDGLADQDSVRLSTNDPALRGTAGAPLDDAIVFGATGRAHASSHVGGKDLDVELDERGQRFDAVVKEMLGG